MPERHSPLAKPDYRLWLSYFCLPLLMILLGSVVLWVVQKRTGLTDWSGLLNYVRNNYWNWDWNLSTVLATAACSFILLSLTQLLLGTYRWVCFRKRRIDLWLCTIAGIFAGWLLVPPFSSRYPDWLLDPSSVLWLLLYGLLLLPFFGILRQFDCLFAKHKPTASNLGRIQPDAPIKFADQDLFEWSGKATAFGREVLHAPDGTAFGVEAPWGTGKTSFINLCEQNWQEQPKFTVVVYRFELLKYAGNTPLCQTSCRL
ncbi:P-loop NTPase fold protein [Iodobacter sp.]|uniref:P-loop NTPase fold protein n=1 Tax=Iodobacter sp. TaxID=1915058 RepID=UPI0025DADE65|nr:P-loop NTPase fold protein [Iodobacter sp.]